MKPISSLPWHTGSINKEIVDATSQPVAGAASIGDSQYIVHACNAYPKLVQALREAADNIAYRGGNERADAYRALLNDLGENG